MDLTFTLFKVETFGVDQIRSGNVFHKIMYTGTGLTNYALEPC